jgi:hypothetical protein
MRLEEKEPLAARNQEPLVSSQFRNGFVGRDLSGMAWHSFAL